jgi:hypothetical protein
VVYPALALIIVWARDPGQWRKTAWLFLISAIYIAVHLWASPLPEAGPYRLYWDLSLVKTFAAYTSWALGPVWLSLVGVHSVPVRIALGAPLAVGMLAFLVWKIRERRWTALLFPAWFAISLAPLLPLRDHMNYAYLTVPVIGLAMWGAWAVASSRPRAAIPLVVLYLGVSIPVAHALTVRFHDRSIRLRTIFNSVVELHRTHPETAVILKNVDSDLFHDMIYHHAFRLAGVRVYVAPEDAARIDLRGRSDAMSEFSIDPQLAAKALEQKSAVVFDVGR